MSSYIKESTSARCQSEYDPLRRVLLCPPRYMEIKDVINDVQKRYKDENIDVAKALHQHTEFVQALIDQGVQTDLIEPSEEYPEQVFTRDIGFTIGDTVFISEMASEIRQGEEQELEKWMEAHDVNFKQLTGHRIEGGDVIMDRDTVFVGISSRTSKKAIRDLQLQLLDFEVIPISFNEKYLHLDCVFNILSPTEALVFPEALDMATVQMLAERYTLIRVNEKEQFALGTNVLSIGDRKVFSQPQNRNVNKQLTARGFHVIEVDYSEIIKSGGAFRCCTMPLIRA
ncbi:dimethylarginine dimethylaminohydrolase family protein [Planococcus sp. ISL-110]|uniref:dimethylarginine dimethylaminohydrolase family protein n=1 Tax=Planococcus sp. ISL-110 TaxID=2819167 RepID=UPI001BE7DA15|nr:dimethylarginine dimethylaminohydrolase family protein [Planococcus sp. ISL-110]MBT2571389.1 dimethylarginine dimethylaminohydrolase family protein [Planococcus sp. ISL-110]